MNMWTTVSGTYQNAVIKLHCGGVLEEVLEGGGEGQEVIRQPALTHFGKGVVHEACIQPCYKCP